MNRLSLDGAPLAQIDPPHADILRKLGGLAHGVVRAVTTLASDVVETDQPCTATTVMRTSAQRWSAVIEVTFDLIAVNEVPKP